MACLLLMLYVVLVGTLLRGKEKNTLLNLLISVLRDRLQVIYCCDIKNKNKLVIHKVKLESTKIAFFYRGR